MNWWNTSLAIALIYASGTVGLMIAGLSSYDPDDPIKRRREDAKLVFHAWKWPLLTAKSIRARWQSMRADANHTNEE
ncbi:hypothetical protein [Leucobacter aridicollis]|uniref:Uncharacterized protein n=1 Tax=Leucobacter aridicollis TaxID=283878 RepID=A0A852R582_9MICO|nr:hypothetical protein [Leucobacter aridicollis]NYD26108.1 hypothetical protein [Leucobacter aridicollis]